MGVRDPKTVFCAFGAVVLSLFPVPGVADRWASAQKFPKVAYRWLLVCEVFFLWCLTWCQKIHIPKGSNEQL